MTYYIQPEDYSCKKCSAIFIPFNKNIVCPRCGTSADTDVHYSFLKDLGYLIFGHKLRYKRCIPSGWFGISTKNKIEMKCFELFDRLEYTQPDNELEWLKNEAVKIKTQENFEYLRKHVCDIVSAIYPTYRRKNRFKPSRFRYWLAKQAKKLLPYLP